MLTGWILMAFSDLAPKGELAELGTAGMRRQIGLFMGFPLQNFPPTSENSFLFLPYLPRWKAGLSTIYCVFAKRPSYCNRNALHTATETPFTVQPKRPSHCNRNVPVFGAMGSAMGQSFSCKLTSNRLLTSLSEGGMIQIRMMTSGRAIRRSG
jgi:hypothetical protein